MSAVCSRQFILVRGAHRNIVSQRNGAIRALWAFGVCSQWEVDLTEEIGLN